MKNTKTSLAICTMSAAMLMSSCGLSDLPLCGGDHSEKDAPPVNNCVLFVGGTIEGQYAPDYSVAEDSIDNLLKEGGYTAVICPDGNAVENSTGLVKVEPLDDTLVDNSKQLRKNKNAIITQLVSAKALTPEHDVLGGITVAAEKIRGSGASNATIIVCDSGVQTTGVLDFRALVNDKEDSSIWKLDTEKVCEQLSELKALPELSGVSVEWYGLGETSGAQRLNSADKENLITIWQAIIEKAGGTFVNGGPYSVCTLVDEDELPDVSVIESRERKVEVEIENEDSVPDEAPVQEPEPEPAPIVEIKIPDSMLSFKADSAEIGNPSKAAATLSDVIDVMIAYPDKKIAIVGTCATVGKADSARSFSKKRAEAVKNLLVSEGCNPDNIIVYGFGYDSDNKFHTDDLDENGALIENLAKQNRAVYILEPDSPKLAGK